MNLILAATTAAVKAAAPLTLATAAAAHAVKGKAVAPNVTVLPPQPVATQAPQVHTYFQLHFGWLTHGLAGLFILSAISLITLLAIQTTKQEGLSGTLGGRVESAYGRPGAEEQLKRITGLAATFFVVCGCILALTGI